MKKSEQQKVLEKAERGYAFEQNLAGLMYLSGDGVEKDPLKAARLFRMAAGRGLREAQFNLAELLRNGMGVAQDYAAARRYYEFAADQGVNEARYCLGQIHEFGLGAPANGTEAAKWYRLAAEAGHAEAQYFLGGLYVEGNGVPRDMVEAYFWFTLAADQEDPNGIDCRDMIAHRMTAKQIEQAVRRTEKFYCREPFENDEDLH